MKAKRETIALGDLSLDVFQLPDGSYVMSQTQVAAAIGKGRQNLSDFLGSKWLKALPGADRSCQTFERIEIEGRGRDINAVPLEIAFLYWVFQVSQKNREAIAVVVPLGSETLARRADSAFGITRSEAEYEAATSEMMKLLGRVARERDILLDSYAIDDDARAIVGDLTSELDRRDRRLEQLEDFITEHGLDVPDE
ncbi:MAG: hypothetical protein HC795_08210 [Coleofasciculaceae cyanobacterium RL_1_1]|nr:hypothetical protein [Coleofasciculaceae cyanobacterium RL_1_1]